MKCYQGFWFESIKWNLMRCIPWHFILFVNGLSPLKLAQVFLRGMQMNIKWTFFKDLRWYNFDHSLKSTRLRCRTRVTHEVWGLTTLMQAEGSSQGRGLPMFVLTCTIVEKGLPAKPYLAPIYTQVLALGQVWHFLPKTCDLSSWTLHWLRRHNTCRYQQIHLTTAQQNQEILPGETH